MSTETKQKCDVCKKVLANNEVFCSIQIITNGQDEYSNDIDICLVCAGGHNISVLRGIAIEQMLSGDQVITAQQGEEE